MALFEGQEGPIRHDGVKGLVAFWKGVFYVDDFVIFCWCVFVISFDVLLVRSLCFLG